MQDVCELGDVTPTKFLGLVVRPLGETWKATEMGKVMGTLMSDQVTLKVHTNIQVVKRVFKFLPTLKLLLICVCTRFLRQWHIMQIQRKQF